MLRVAEAELLLAADDAAAEFRDRVGSRARWASDLLSAPPRSRE
jgi:hypothetical protein